MASRASLLAVAMVAFAVAAEAQMPPPPPPMVLIPGLPALPPIPPKYMKKVQKMFMQAMKYGVEYYESSGSEDTCGGDRTPREIMTGMPIKEGCKTANEGDEVCACVKHPSELKMKLNKLMDKLELDMPELPETSYGNVCGKCVDPCSLMWKPDLPDIDMDKAMKFGEKMYDEMMKEMKERDMPEVPKVVKSMLSTAMEIIQKKMGDKWMDMVDAFDSDEQDDDDDF